MRRSWAALVVVLVVIGGAIFVHSTRKPRATGEGEGAPIARIESPAGDTQVGKVEPPKEEDKKGSAKPGTESPAKPVEPPKPVVPEQVLKEADGLLAAGKPLEAIRALSKAVMQDPTAANLEPLKARLTAHYAEPLFSSKPCPPLSVTHRVVSGETLGKIAKAHTTTFPLIMRLNGLTSHRIDVGQMLKVVPGAFDVEVVKSRFLLTVTKDGLWVREFQVGLGKDGSTPIGEFVAGHKITEPTYFGDGAGVPYGDKKNNPLGTRWITIEGAGGGQYGIHGTWEPESVGKEESKGCVRMRNEDVEWLFDLVVPGHSKIAIKP